METKQKPNSFAALFAKHKTVAAPTKIAQSNDRLLHGTGITKKVIEQANRTQTKQAEQESVLHLDESEAQPALIDLDLPTTIAPEGIELDNDQQAALDGLRNQKYGCLIGAAGTGKTTTLKALIAQLEKTVKLVDLDKTRPAKEQKGKADMNIAICFCSFTGRAVQQIKRVLPKEYQPLCNTIHRTLGYMPTTEERPDPDNPGEIREVRVFRPTFTKHNKLPYKVCIVDEAGTVGINLWDELIDALPDDCRIILVGDINQLPPVQGRSVLGFAMIKWPTFTLEKLHRNAGVIAEQAHRVLYGQKPISNGNDFIVSTMPDGSLATHLQAQGVLQHLHKNGIFDPLRDAFIVPQNKGNIGQLHFNECLVKYFNQLRYDEFGKPINPRVIITAGYIHVPFAVGDKVMLLANDNQLGLTNGMIGVVHEIANNAGFKGDNAAAQMCGEVFDEEIDLTDLGDVIDEVQDHKDEEIESERQASHIMKVQFQNCTDLVEFSTAGAYKKVTHAYAATCHKSQGGEYHTVVVLIHSANLRMLTREWLYTAITRAQHRVVLLVNNRGLIHAVNQQTIKGKTVAEKAKSFLALQDQKDTKLPNLPEPVTLEMED